jgi:glycosyltransferase involved in cell wall biosynthesis
MAEQLRMPGIIDSYHLDLVHIPYFNIPLFLKTPFVVTMHDVIVNEHGTGRASRLPYPLYHLKRLGYHLVTSQAIKKARSIIVPSQSTKSDLLEHYKVPQSNIHVTYEGVDDSDTKNIEKPTISVKPYHYFLCVGNAYPHKNIERLIEAFSALSTTFHLVLVGPNNYFSQKLKTMVSEKGIKRIIFTGYMKDKELFWLYKNARALVFPSLAEGFGLPALEAMSMGTPILASNISVFKELFSDIPSYFDPYDVEDIAHSLTKALNEPAHKQNKKGMKLAQSYSWEKMAIETVNIYESSTRLRPY